MKGEAPRKPTSRGLSKQLNVEKIVREFQKEEESSTHRNGTFKIDSPFEAALETIMKAKPEPKKRKPPKK